MYHCFSEKNVKARKPRPCIWCGQRINAGDIYVHEKSIYYGNFQNHRWHPECKSYADEQFKTGDTEFMPYSNERSEIN